MTENDIRDGELELLIQRALDLRLTMQEIAQAADATHVAIWRWRNGARPNWVRRQRAIEGIEALIQKQKNSYGKV